VPVTAVRRVLRRAGRLDAELSPADDPVGFRCLPDVLTQIFNDRF
jgi:hypothetical protein